MKYNFVSVLELDLYFFIFGINSNIYYIFRLLIAAVSVGHPRKYFEVGMPEFLLEPVLNLAIYFHQSFIHYILLHAYACRGYPRPPLLLSPSQASQSEAFRQGKSAGTRATCRRSAHCPVLRQPGGKCVRTYTACRTCSSP